MIYLGLDLSTVSTGYSVFNDYALIEWGKVVPKTADTLERIVEITEALEKIVSQHLPEVIVVEDVYYGSNYLVTKMLNRLAGAVLFMLRQTKSKVVNYHKQEVIFAMPTDARKCFGLLPKSTKANIVSAVNAKYKLSLGKKDDDIADGIVLGYAAVYKNTNPNALYKSSEQKFFKTQVRGMKTPPIKGMKPRRKKK